MADKGLGFVKIYRSLQRHWLWTADEPFDIRSAWIDLILTVNHEDATVNIGRRIITIHAGQTWTSYEKLANRWKWSRERVYRYIKMLKDADMIYTDSHTNGTLLTLTNYGKFANRETKVDESNESTTKTPVETPSIASGKTQTRMIKNDKEHESIRKDQEPPRGGGEWQ